MPKGRYKRTLLAQQIHTNLFEYLKLPSAENLAIFKKSVSGASTSEFLELSANGCSLLIDIFHLSMQIGLEKRKTVDSINQHIKNLLEVVLTRCNSPKTAKLLIIPNHDLQTPLHYALHNGNLQNLHFYLHTLVNAHAAHCINDTQFNLLLTGSNLNGLTPLHEAAMTGNYALLVYFFITLEQSISAEDIYRNLLSATCKGYIPNCNPGKPEASLINSYLDGKRIYFRQQLEKNQEAVAASSPTVAKPITESKILKDAPSITTTADSFFHPKVDSSIKQDKTATKNTQDKPSPAGFLSKSSKKKEQSGGEGGRKAAYTTWSPPKK